MSDNNLQNPGDAAAYPVQPAAPQPPAYNAPPAYGSAPQYPAQAPYGAAPSYPYAQQKTNTLAIVSLIASIAGFVFLPFIGSVVGVITGHMALNQLKTTGENGRGLALAGTILGWVGVALSILGVILFFVLIAGIAASGTGTYGT